VCVAPASWTSTFQFSQELASACVGTESSTVTATVTTSVIGLLTCQPPVAIAEDPAASVPSPARCMCCKLRHKTTRVIFVLFRRKNNSKS
jgi:hypothetical protein